MNIKVYDLRVFPLNLSKKEIGSLVAIFTKRFPAWALLPRWYIENSRANEYQIQVVRNISSITETSADALSGQERDRMQEFVFGFAEGLKAANVANSV